MKIDFHTYEIYENTGYGKIAKQLKSALERHGIEHVPGAPVAFNFCMPRHYIHSEYNIGYTPWESTEVPDDWVYPLRGVDQLWTTCSWLKEVFAKFRPRDEVSVWGHGIEPEFLPVERNSRIKPFRFLFVGDPAIRKGSEYVLAAWHQKFGDRKDVQLVYKCMKYPRARIKDSSGSIIASPGMFDNIDVIGNSLDLAEYVSLLNSCHAMIYPSRGEGFGMIPFEALATGMPVIMPNETGMKDFSEFTPPELLLTDIQWRESFDQTIHPGSWMELSSKEVMEKMELVVANYDNYAEYAFQRAHDLHTSYDWDTVGQHMAAYLVASVPYEYH